MGLWFAFQTSPKASERLGNSILDLSAFVKHGFTWKEGELCGLKTEVWISWVFKDTQQGTFMEMSQSLRKRKHIFLYRSEKLLGTLSTWCLTVVFDVDQVWMFILWERTDILKWGEEKRQYTTKIPFQIIGVISLSFQDGLRLCSYPLETIIHSLEKIRFILNVFVLVLDSWLFLSQCL